MRKYEDIKREIRRKYGDEHLEFVEYLEQDLKAFAELTDYNYLHSDYFNYHIYKFSITKQMSDEDVKIINAIINTYDEGTVTHGVMHLGDIFVTIVGTD